MKKEFPFYKQADFKDCGPTCLKIITKYYKKKLTIQQLRELSETTRVGSSLLGLSDASEKIGFRSLGVKVALKQLLEAPLPCILHWNKNHYVVLYKSPSQPSQRERVKKGLSRLLPWNTEDEHFYISDPAYGLLKYTQEEFLKNWIGGNATDETEEGIAEIITEDLRLIDRFFYQFRSILNRN